MDTTWQAQPANFDNSITPFLRLPVLFEDLSNVQIAYRKIGRGPALLFLHGWPFSGFCFRKLLPFLCSQYTCYLIDIPGAGESKWTKSTDFRFNGQIQTLLRFTQRLFVEKYNVLGHDSGGILARYLAIHDAKKVDKLILLNTEAPTHRPPWIPFYAKLMSLPGHPFMLRRLLLMKSFLWSSAGFGGCFFRPALYRRDFEKYVIQPILTTSYRLDGLSHYLRGIDWALLDQLSTEHKNIQAKTLLIWGQEDPTFPVKLSHLIASQIPGSLGPKIIPNAKLLVQEEQPEKVSAEILAFLSS